MTSHARRLETVRRRLEQLGLDCLLVDQPENRRYLTGFTGSTGLVVVTADDVHLITDARYYERVEREAPDVSLVQAGHQTMDHLEKVVASTGAARIGFEAHHLTWARVDGLRKRISSSEWVATELLVEQLRAVKDADEIAVMARAAALTDAALRHALDTARPGMTERGLAWSLESYMRQNGAEGLAFDVIVACGPNGALPHHSPSDATVETGEPIVIDIGARVDGYCADLTRTVCFGQPRDADYEEVWGLALAAHQAVMEQLRPGMSGRDADKVARQVIIDGGYGDNFAHGLGHGVGLYIHELPRLSNVADDSPLLAGMTMTVEPGIYLPGRFGVRIEDLVVLRDDGPELLSAAPRQATVEPAMSAG